jgi:hypothetical protein
MESSYSQRIQALRDRYPYQFARVFAYGMSIEPGWLSIFERVCAAIDSELEASGTRKSNFSWLQIKEKLGSARFAWDRSWSVPEGRLSSCAYDEPDFIFQEAMPQDPEADQFESIEAYLASPRAAEWDRLHMIPNPALANVKREPQRYFERLMTIDFDDGVTDAEQDYITRSITMLVTVPEAVSERIRTIVEGAEEEASRTCQFCSAPGMRKHLEDGWIVCACEQHSSREAIAEFNKVLESERGGSEKT